MPQLWWIPFLTGLQGMERDKREASFRLRKLSAQTPLANIDRPPRCDPRDK